MFRPSKSSLHTKLIKVFWIQIGLISIVTLGGIYAAKSTLEGILVRAALQGEAEYFWQMRQQDPEFSLPNTMNLQAYMAPLDALQQAPQPLRGLSPGMHRVDWADLQPIVYVDEQHGQRLFLVFDEVKVSRLALVFGIMPLALVLLVLYLLAWIAYRQSHRAVSPIEHLAKMVAHAQFKAGERVQLDLDSCRRFSDDEVSSLVSALDQFTVRIDQFLERERHFIRDASHELRTPIAVLRSSLEVFERKVPEVGRPQIQRMFRTLYDMESLIETLLLLAREEGSGLPVQRVIVNDVMTDELETIRSIYQDKQLSIHVEEAGVLAVRAPERVLQILISNLLRNAFSYTQEGTITVRIAMDHFSVADSGVGMNAEQIDRVFTPFFRSEQAQITKGFGIGMTIVKRLCDRFAWQLQLSSSVGQGTQVTVLFPASAYNSRRVDR